jgi:hypothetical protein
MPLAAPVPELTVIRQRLLTNNVVPSTTKPCYGSGHRHRQSLVYLPSVPRPKPAHLIRCTQLVDGARLLLDAQQRGLLAQGHLRRRARSRLILRSAVGCGLCSGRTWAARLRPVCANRAPGYQSVSYMLLLAHGSDLSRKVVSSVAGPTACHPTPARCKRAWAHAVERPHPLQPERMLTRFPTVG